MCVRRDYEEWRRGSECVCNDLVTKFSDSDTNFRTKNINMSYMYMYVHMLWTPSYICMYTYNKFGNRIPNYDTETHSS